ncbi:MAG: DoxX family protein [Puniceicoccales bacterium]|jgi:putative oxidoreductase|nr:DoxX family protein [Puniceicoccales bacterium]
MIKLKQLLNFEFIPLSRDIALLVLRLWFGLTLLTVHGWAKLSNFSETAPNFPNLFGLGGSTNLLLAIFVEVVGSLLIITGVLTRLAAALGIVTMAVAFFMVHHAALTGEHSGELAYTYLGAFLVLFIAGGGRYSIDAKVIGPSAYSVSPAPEANNI